jgi:hypothetical protein
VKKEFAIFVGILLLIAAALYLVDAYGMLKPKKAPLDGQEITIEEFKGILSSQEDFSILMIMEQDTTKNKPIVECAVGFAGGLSSIGKSPKNYGIEGDSCVKSDLSNATLAECEKEFAGSYQFIIKYGVPSTHLYAKKAAFFVDESSSNCSIAQAPSGG